MAAQSYDRFMGRFSTPLAEQFVALLDLRPSSDVLDVGCGPGALTRVLVDRLGVDHVAAVDPSEPFVQAVRQRLPGVDVRTGRAAELPFGDRRFGAALAQLVVHFMPDPVAGLREMSRVTVAGGTVSASVWDHAGGSGPLALFWDQVRARDPHAHDEADLPGAREGDLARLAHDAGLSDVEEHVLRVRVPFTSFEDWWEPFTLGVGPAGAYVSGLDEVQRDSLRESCREALPDNGFEIPAAAWCVVGRAAPSAT